jgi:hypothetical protein
LATLLNNVILLFVLYGGPGIAALLFLLLGFKMAHSRVEVVSVALLAGALAAVQAGELYFLWGLRRAMDGEVDDPLALVGALITLAAVAANILFLRRLKRAPFSGGMR